jgi:divalent metal cation (Fe/Co/Zn/Cd) transporter
MIYGMICSLRILIDVCEMFRSKVRLFFFFFFGFQAILASYIHSLVHLVVYVLSCLSFWSSCLVVKCLG